MGEQSKKIAV